MDKKETCIAPEQVLSFVTMAMVGYRLLILPNKVVQTAQRDGWLSVLLAGLITIGATCLVASYGLRFSGYHFPETLRMIYGKWLGTTIHVLLTIFILIKAGFNMTEFSLTLRVVLLTRTPPWAVWVPMLVVCGYAANAGLETIARLFDLLLLGVVVAGGLSAPLAFQVVDFRNLMPIMAHGPIPVLKGIWVSLDAFTDLAAVILLVPYVRQTRSYIRMAAYSIGIITVVNTVATLQCIGAFGVGETTYLYAPLLTLAKTVHVKFILVERLEIFLMFVWIPVAFATVEVYLFVAASLTRIYWRVPSRFWSVIVVSFTLIIGLAAAVAPDAATNEHLLDVADNMANGIVLVFIPLTYLIAVIRGKRGKQNGEPAYQGCTSRS